MKRFIIKNADGTQQYVMPAIQGKKPSDRLCSSSQQEIGLFPVCV